MAKAKQAASRGYDKLTQYSPQDAVDLVKNLSYAKFDESVDIVFTLGIDPKKADQLVRGTVSLPHGTGKAVRVAVFAQGEEAKAAEEAGADVVGGKELADEIQSGKQALDFDVTIASPDMMPVVGKLGPVLGPRGLMPNPKSGTVTPDVGKTVAEFKAGKVEYRNDRYGNVHVPVGRVSFDAASLVDNVTHVADEITRSKPASAKGRYIKKVAISSTMGPGIKVDSGLLEDLRKALA